MKRLASITEDEIMADVIFIAITIIFFASCYGLIIFFDSLTRNE